jgi:hypothetical protein
MAVKKKASQRKRAGINFSPTTAIEMYKAGKGLSEIAQAMGYPPNRGQNRVRYALEKAGIYKKGARRTQRATPAKAPAVSAAPAKQDLNMPIPDTPEVALAICLRTVDVNVSKLNLDNGAKVGFAKRLMGMIAANYGITEFQVRKPVMVLDETRTRPYLIAPAASA